MTADSAVRTPTAVGALYDSISPNTGDRAIGLAVAQELARHGVRTTEILPPFSDPEPESRLVIIGGGELIRPVGDPFYDRFRVAGPAVLNAVGVWADADHLDHLKDYRKVTARSTREVDVLRSAAPDAELLPCTTTTLRSEHFPVEGLPDDGEPVVGIQLVPHTLNLVPELVEAINAIPHRKVLIPFTHYNNDDSFMRALPLDRSNVIELPRLTPLQLHSVIGQMTYVLVSSLHATIFAYSQNVPFVTAHQDKVVNYLRDRSLEHLVYRDVASLTEAVRRVEETPQDFTGLIAKDAAAIDAAFTEYAAMLGVTGADPVEPEIVDPGEHYRSAVELLATQREEIVLGRDATIALLTRQLTAGRAEAHELHTRLGAAQQATADRSADLAAARRDIAALRERLEATMGGRLRSAARKVAHRTTSADDAGSRPGQEGRL